MAVQSRYDSNPEPKKKAMQARYAADPEPMKKKWYASGT